MVQRANCVASFLTSLPPHSTAVDFVANELEHTNGTDRYHFDAAVPQQDLVDSYLPSFQACVEEGEVSSVMVRVLLLAATTGAPLTAFSPNAVLLQCRKRRAELRV